MHQTILRAWTRRGAIAILLWPLALLYQCLAWLRRQLYGCGVFESRRVDALVVVVGNVVAGGAGKTPTVISVVQHLQAQGFNVGVVSRGYGRTATGCMEVLSDSPPHLVGDEPLLIQRATQCHVFVGRSRHAAATALMLRHPQTQIVICDDGLQHYGLYRDLEICVFGDRGCGNGLRLPAGPLRESWPRRAVGRVGQSDARLLVLHTGSKAAFAGYRAERELAPFALDRAGHKTPLTSLDAPGAPAVLALAGIAQPETFFSMLRALKVPLAKTLAFSDHYQFDSELSPFTEGYRIICTEKDAVKLWSLACDALAVPLVFRPEPAFFAALDSAVAERRAAKLSSEHGHKTT